MLVYHFMLSASVFHVYAGRRYGRVSSSVGFIGLSTNITSCGFFHWTRGTTWKDGKDGVQGSFPSLTPGSPP